MNQVVKSVAFGVLCAIIIIVIANLLHSGPYYTSCAEARSAGAAPIHKGDAGYRPGLDLDGDGVACDLR